MNILYFTYFLNALWPLLLAIGLGIVLTRRFGLPWRLYWVGAITFVLSQVGHIPFNSVVLNWLVSIGMPQPPASLGILAVAVFAGLSSGLWEETSRLVMYRWVLKDARSWRKALLIGAGHGGIEAIIVGLLAGWAFLQAVALLGVADLSQVASGDQLAQIRVFLDSYWSAPWYASLLGALERTLALPLHLAMSALVLQVFTRRQWGWWLASVLWHALVNGCIYAVLQFTHNAYLSELTLAVFTIGSLAIIWKLRRGEPLGPDEVLPPVSLTPSPEPIVIQPVDETAESLEKSKFNG